MRGDRGNSMVRAIAIWDLALTAPFALPYAQGTSIEILYRLNALLSPQVVFPVFSPLHLFFVQLFGIMCVLWAVIRIHKPGVLLGIYDTLGRFLIGLCMIAFGVSEGFAITMAFSCSEILLGCLQTAFLFPSLRDKSLAREPLPRSIRAATTIKDNNDERN